MKATGIIFEGQVLVPADNLLNSHQAAKIKNVTRQAVEIAMKRDQLPVYEVAGKKLVHIEDWKKFSPPLGRPRKKKAQAVTA